MELRELAISPAFAILLILVGLIVGHEFISSMETYAELSGAKGGGDMLARGMNPLDGILVPTFGAYDIAATLLLPFVVIRLFSNERTTGAWTLLVQSRASVAAIVANKVFVLCIAWLIALLPGFAAIALWKSYGGHVYLPELWSLVLGHLVRAAITISLAAAAASVTRQAASAAIITLGVTIGSWALDFTAATHGGVWAKLAAFTPAGALRPYEQGLVSVTSIVVMTAVCATGLLLAIAWLSPASGPRTRISYLTRALVVVACYSTLAVTIHTSWDATEDRRHSFSESDEALLRSLPGTLSIEVHLAADDPRLMDFRGEILDRLEREVRHTLISFAGSSGTDLLRSADPHYGEIWYGIGGKRVMLKSAIEPVVLQTIYDLAGIKAAPAAESENYPGYPLKSDAPPLAWVAFFVVWPVMVLTALYAARKR
jgi:ABC-2 type transport system permease protein